MESHQPENNQEIESPPDGQTPRQRRFRIMKLEERIAPKKGGNETHKCDYTGYCLNTMKGCDTTGACGGW